MLIKLLPDQVNRHWEPIRYALLVSLPPTARVDRENNILKALLSGEMDAWVATRDARPVGVLVTTLTMDGASETKNLLVYALASLDETILPDDVWLEGIEQLRKYAESKGCHRIIGYTESSRIAQMIQKVGGQARYTFVSVDVK